MGSSETKPSSFFGTCDCKNVEPLFDVSTVASSSLATVETTKVIIPGKHGINAEFSVRDALLHLRINREPQIAGRNFADWVFRKEHVTAASPHKDLLSKMLYCTTHGWMASP